MPSATLTFDPQLVWRGKYDGDDALSIMAPPLYIQEKVHLKVLVEDLLREAAAAKATVRSSTFSFADELAVPSPQKGALTYVDDGKKAQNDKQIKRNVP